MDFARAALDDPRQRRVPASCKTYFPPCFSFIHLSAEFFVYMLWRTILLGPSGRRKRIAALLPSVGNFLKVAAIVAIYRH
jgi:hypothetical protein